MIELQQLTVKNYVKYKEATLPLNRIGVTKITGKNLDSTSKLTNVNDDTNAVGKTALLSAISQIIFASNPLTQDVKSKAKKDVFTAGTSIALQLKQNEKIITVEKLSKGKSTSYLMHKDKDNTNIRTKKYTEEKIRSIFGMSEDEFYTLWFISSSRPSRIQYGTAASRFQFFTNFFKLQAHDEVKKLFLARLRDAENCKIQLDEVNKQLLGIEYSKESYSEVISQRDTLSEKLSSIVEKKKVLEKQKQDFDFFNATKNTVSDLENTLKELGIEFPKKEKDAVHLKEMIAYLLSRNDSNKELDFQYQTYKKEYIKYKERKKELKQLLSGWTFIDIREWENAKEELNAKINEASKGITEIDFDLTEYKDLKKTTKHLDPKEIKNELKDIESKISVTENDIKNLSKLDGCKTCPTCKNGLEKGYAVQMLETAKNLLKTLQKTHKKVRSNLETITRFSELENLKTEYESNLENKERLNKYIEKYKKLKANTDFVELQKEYENLKKPEQVEPINMMTATEHKNYSDALSLLKIVAPLLDRFNSVKHAQEHNETNFDTYEKLEKKIEKINTNLPSILAKIEVLHAQKIEKKKLEKRKEKLTLEVADIPVLKLLVEAYSNNGLKLRMINSIAQLVEKNMNTYASLVYPEKAVFKFSITNNRDFNILAKIGKAKVFQDIRTLSGAESRAFSFLLPLSLMPLIPREKRLNLMVLDEPTNNMGTARLELFVKNFIPKLNQLVPHLVVISTTDEVYNNSVTYEVKKEKGESILTQLNVGYT